MDFYKIDTSIKHNKNVVKYIEFIFKEVKLMFDINEELFPLSIINDVKNEYAPIFYYEHMNPVEIVINCDINQWDRFSFQLTHEIMHYIIFNYYIEKDLDIPILKWFEETLCEAFSLYFLELSAQKYIHTGLFFVNRTYAKNFREYLNNLLNKKGNTPISNIIDLSELKIIENSAESNRNLRFLERSYIYTLMIDRDFDFKEIIKYRKYLEPKNENLTIDFEKWKSEYVNPSFLEKIKYIQPTIMK